MLPLLRPVSFVETFPGGSAEAVNFITQCLTFNPKRRCSVLEALRHPFVAEFHDPDDEPIFPSKLSLPLDDYQLHTTDQYREAVYETMRIRKVQARKLEHDMMKNPAKVILMEFEETLPEPF